jgi:hypothetical protein
MTSSILSFRPLAITTTNRTLDSSSFGLVVSGPLSWVFISLCLGANPMPHATGLTITNPLVLYRALIATNRLSPDPSQLRLGMHISSKSFAFSLVY